MNKRKHTVQSKAFPVVQYKHDLGQHFLYDTELLRSLVEKTGLQSSDHVLEIGAGAGTLTRVLCETAARVTAVEVDEALLPILRMLAVEYENLTIIQNDIRKVNLHALDMGEEFRVIANLPYSITSQILDLFWGTGLAVSQMAVMVQKEVAEKLVATPGDKTYGLMSVRCRYYCIPEIVAQIPASAFTPPPKVDSAFVSLVIRTEPLLPKMQEKLFWKLVRASYRLRRKTLVNALKAVSPVTSKTLTEILEGMGLPPTVRGEVLSVAQWIALVKAVEKSTDPNTDEPC